MTWHLIIKEDKNRLSMNAPPDNVIKLRAINHLPRPFRAG